MWTICLLLLLSNMNPVAEQDIPDEDPQVQLAKVRRIFVDTLTGGDSSLMIRDLLMASLQSSKLFIITEDEDRADAVLKGAGDDTVFTDLFSSTDGLNAHANLSIPDFGTSSSGRSVGSGSSGMSVGENESRRSEERKHEAIATVRLVNKGGDVIWSTTQESFGGKFTGAAADVANKVTKRLITDYKLAKQ